MTTLRLTLILATCVALLSPNQVFAKANSDWFQQAAISPDGKSILFSYQGDIYKVNSKGGLATPLTLHDAWEGHPVWSHDGKLIAFASDRHGNKDIFVMPAKGGKAKRLTFHSGNDIPTDFSRKHNAVLFNASRMDNTTSSLFPTRALNELYEVSTSGGTPKMISTTSASEARYSANGKKIVYREEKAYESALRKHDTSNFARDIWVHDLKTNSHKQLSIFKGGDHNPVWRDGSNIYYLSEEQTNNFNVWTMDINTGKNSIVTNYKTHPVRSLSMDKSGTIAYTQHGSIFTKSKKSIKQLKITFATDSRTNDIVNLSVNDKITEFAVSPSGKEIAFVARGEVFVTSADFSTTKRITNTAEQERSISFHKDGRTLLYTSSRNGKWKLFETTLSDENEKYFFAATSLKEELLHSAKTESFQPVYSPDGEKVAFLAGRDEIQIIDRKSKVINVALPKKYNYSYADGDISFHWSPDSLWLTADFAPRGRLFITNIGIFPSDGSAEPIDISHSGYQDGYPTWNKSGDVVYWFSSRFGMRAHGSWGRQFDVMASFLNQDAFDKFSMSKEEYQLMKEIEEDAEKKEKELAKDDSEDKKEDSDKEEDDDDKVTPIKIAWDDLDDRTVRLTDHSSDLSSSVLNEDFSKLYYLARFEKGYDLWVKDFKEGKTSLAAKLGASSAQIILSSDEKSLFILADGKISKADIGDKITPKGISANAVMELKPSEERAHMFEHAWRKIKDKFYNTNMHGIDWDLMKSEYAAKLPSINNNRDLGSMMEEMMGELNASHTGTYYRFRPSAPDNTAGLGIIFDLSNTKGALTIDEVLDKSPLKKAKSNIQAGMKLTAIDGVKLSAKSNLSQLLNNKAGKRVRLTIMKSDGKTFDEVIKPLSLGAEGQLIYERWVKTRHALVEKLSKGRIGYVHIRGMNDASYRKIYSDILGQNFDKEAIIVDTRWNGGGWLHNDLAKLLSGKNYMNLEVRGRKYSGEPMDQWYKPSLIVMNAGNYSDAHTFPYTYKALNIGDAVGMPVPGTSTSVWWENMNSGDLVFGVPQVGNLNMKGEYLENRQVDPDYLIKNDPESSAAGEDKQISKAVEVMLKTLAK